jgi:hypothetical protein
MPSTRVGSWDAGLPCVSSCGLRLGHIDFLECLGSGRLPDAYLGPIAAVFLVSPG